MIVGEGYTRPDVVATIDEVGGHDWVRLAGHVSDDELIGLYRSAWCVASASEREGWGMTLTEAAACGTPAVVTNIAGHSDATRDELSGLLCDGEKGLTDGLVRLLGDATLRARLQAAARPGRRAHLGTHRHRQPRGALHRLGEFCSTHRRGVARATGQGTGSEAGQSGAAGSP